jgi:hypothetical protein
MRKFSVESTRNISRKFWVVTLGPLLIVILLGILESKLGSNFSWIGSISKTIIVYLVDIIGNKQRMLAGITTAQVLDSGILPVGYEGHKPLPSPNPKSHLWCCGIHLSQCDNV